MLLETLRSQVVFRKAKLLILHFSPITTAGSGAMWTAQTLSKVTELQHYLYYKTFFSALSSKKTTKTKCLLHDIFLRLTSPKPDTTESHRAATLNLS